MIKSKFNYGKERKIRVRLSSTQSFSWRPIIRGIRSMAFLNTHHMSIYYR
jgi:hypothetical protein